MYEMKPKKAPLPVPEVRYIYSCNCCRHTTTDVGEIGRKFIYHGGGKWKICQRQTSKADTIQTIIDSSCSWNHTEVSGKDQHSACVGQIHLQLDIELDVYYIIVYNLHKKYPPLLPMHVQLHPFKRETAYAMRGGEAPTRPA